MGFSSGEMVKRGVILDPFAGDVYNDNSENPGIICGDGFLNPDARDPRNDSGTGRLTR
jgi:hypothetical protein